MSKYKLTIELDDWAEMYSDSLTLENALIDLIKTSVLPTLNLNVVRHQVIRKRG
jgi:hypothetical protein